MSEGFVSGGRRIGGRSLSGGGERAEVGWHISSYSVNGRGECVEAGPYLKEPGLFAVRDSKQPDLGHLSFSSSEWSALLRSSVTA